MIRALAHLFGWHTRACRGDLRCRRLQGTHIVETTGNGWWRYVTPCCDADCREDHA